MMQGFVPLPKYAFYNGKRTQYRHKHNMISLSNLSTSFGKGTHTLAKERHLMHRTT